MPALDPTHEPFVVLAMKVGAYAKIETVNMHGDPNDTANALLHALALFIAATHPPDEAKEHAAEFAETFADLAHRYSVAMQGSKDRIDADPAHAAD